MKLTSVDLSRKRVSDQIKDTIKQTILSGDFTLGDKLPREDQIAVSFDESAALKSIGAYATIRKRQKING